MNSETKIQILLDNTPFPGAGQELGGHKVIESAVDLAGKNWAIYLRGKLTASQAKVAVSELTQTYFALPVQDEFSLVGFKTKAMTHARTNPPGDVTVVRGHMYYARPNPMTKSAFDAEMDEMLIDDPEKYFTKYSVNTTDALHKQLWKGVSYAGESYGWKKGNDLWHRRASFIMPKIKINKALKGATMFYHTHPSKDEPSLTSADDIQFYLDLHFRWGIKSFYTVMKHKLDHFTITGKAGGKEKYLRMEEDAFIDAVDGLIGKGEVVAKKEVGDGDDIAFQNRITKEMVDLFNKKFKSIANISFRPKSKNPVSKLARKSYNPVAALVNPQPNPPIRLEDRYVAAALGELKGLDYAHEHYGADEYGHTMYVYWWLKHHLAPTAKQPKGRLFKLNNYGMDSDTRKKLRAYLSQPIIGNYNYMDAVYLLALYHDIAKLREKGSKVPGWKIGADMFREEIGPELDLPERLTEDLAFLFDTDLGRKGITDENFLTQSGDYYGVSKLVQMADMVTHHPTMYTKKGGEAYKQEAMVQMIDQLRNFLDHNYAIPNPPPRVNTLQWIANYGIEDIAYEEAEELLGEFHQSLVPDADGKTKQREDKSSGGHMYYMRFNSEIIPSLTRTFAAQLALSSSKLTVYVKAPAPDDLAVKAANEIYQLVGSRLKESYPEIELEEPTTPSIVNPRHASKVQVICISGPSGGGKSTVLRYLNKNLPNSSTPPTYTTRPRRPTDGDDRKFITKTQFKKMIGQGKFVEYAVQGNGHFYGRVFDDFAGDYAIIEVSLNGKKAYESRFPNVFTVYLDPDPNYSEEERAKAIFRRGGLSKEEAKRRAKKAVQTVARSKKMQFDLRVTMTKGKYHEGARKVLSELPLINANHNKEFISLDVGITAEEQEEAERAREERKEAERAGLAEAAEKSPQGDLDVGITAEEQEEADRRLAEEKERIRREEEEEEEARRQYEAELEERFTQTALPFSDEEETNPKDLFDWFEDWAKLINMKNKELKTFLDSDWGKVAGLSPQEAKKLGINSGRTSGRRILKMREKLGLGGPKDYIKGPRHLEDMYAKAIDNWTGPASKKGTDWYWCTRQVRFNKRFMGDNFGERKGPLVKKQKTQNQPSRRLLSLWVWGHDPWRYARKNGVNRMPKCPDVPWVGRTEKIKYGKIEVIPGPRKNPPPMISAPDLEKWESRYGTITTATIDELADMANKQLEELKVDHGMSIFTPEWTIDAPDFISQKIRDKILKWANNEVKQYRIRLFDDKTPNQTITQRNAVFIESPIPEEILDYLYDKKTTKRGGVYLEGGRVHLFLGRFSGPRGKVSYRVSQAVATMANQAKTRFPYTYGGFGGSMRESLRGKGYYGLVKLIDAFFHELNGWEDYSEGTTPMRTDLYQSYGWLNAYAYPTNTPYFTQAAEDYLESKRKGPSKDARYDSIWRPVYSAKSNPPTRQNIPRDVSIDGFTRKDITYSGASPQRLSANLLKAIKGVRHQNREYFGYANYTTLWYATNFMPTQAGGFQDYDDKRQFMEENDIHIGFHTHPIRFISDKFSRLSDVPSPPDYAMTLVEALLYGITTQIVSTQHGFFIIEASYKEGMKKKLEGLKDFGAAVQKETGKIRDAWNPDGGFDKFAGKEWFNGPKTPGTFTQFTVDYINSITKYFKFRVAFLDNPIIATKWIKNREREGWVKPVNQIKVNPHYSPPPGIAMFPGELHQGPAALYQQTISISQLNPPALSTEVEAHKQVEVQYQRQKFEVDELMAPLLMHLWDNGVHTLFSCQGGDFDDPKWEHWRSSNDPRERVSPHFYEEDGEPGFYNSWTHGYIVIDGGWEYVAHRLRDLLWTEGGMRPSTFNTQNSAYRNGAEIWVESDYHKWGMMTHPKMSMTLQWRGRPDYENLRHIYHAFGLEFPEAKTNPPPRSKPFPWNKNRVKKSPFKTMKKAQATYDSWKKGNPIGFTANTSLKSMGKIPRVSGKYELGEKYERINPPLVTINKGWHVTKTEFVPSIMKDGLLMGRPGMSPLGYGVSSNVEMANYMHKTLTRAILFARRRESEHGPQSIIEVDLQPYSNDDVGAEPYEYTQHPDFNERFLNSFQMMITQDIPISQLSVVDQKVIDDFWKREEEAREHLEAMDNPAKKACPKPPKKGIIIYGASWCHWCQEAKKYLDEKGKKYKYVDIDEVKDYHKTIYPLTDNYKYIPVVFVDGKFIGGYSELVAKNNPVFVIGEEGGNLDLRIVAPNRDPIMLEALRAATDKSFKHHKWYVKHHLDYVMAIAKAIVKSDEEEDQQLIHDMVWMHDYPKMMGDKDNYELVREFVSKHRDERYTDRLMNQLRWMEEIKSPDWSGRTTTIAAVMSTADALAHYYGPFFQIFHDENPDTPIAELKKMNKEKLERDKRKVRAGPKRKALDSIKFKYKGRKVRVVGNKHIAELIERTNPMAPGYQSYGWTTQDWRSIKVNSKGDIDYSQKCGAEGTRTKSGKPRLCLPAPVIRSLMKTESGKEVLRQQARKKLRAKKGERVPWHPRIKKLHKKLEERTPEDR